MSIIEIILSSNTAYVLLLYLISAKVQSRRFKETISHTLTKKCTFLELQLPEQSVPITPKAVSSNPVHGEVYSIQHYMIKFVSDL